MVDHIHPTLGDTTVDTHRIPLEVDITVGTHRIPLVDITLADILPTVEAIIPVAPPTILPTPLVDLVVDLDLVEVLDLVEGLDLVEVLDLALVLDLVQLEPLEPPQLVSQCPLELL